MKHLMTVSLFGALAVTAQAGPIAQYLNGTFFFAAGPTGQTEGESFTTPGGGPWNSISFNFYSNSPATTPAAVGTGFLLSMAYAGTTAALSNATPGFIASSTSNAGGIYTFASTVALQPNTQYWIFSNTAFPFNVTGSITAGTSAQSEYTGDPFVNSLSDVLNFTLSGGVVAAPEPSTWALTGAALCGLAFFARRSRRARE
jgi:hypothetical protein